MDFTDTALLGRILERVEKDETDRKKSESESTDCPQPVGEFPKYTPLAMAYVPFQSWEKPYDSVAGLSRGTIFPKLDKPFIGEEAVRNDG